MRSLIIFLFVLTVSANAQEKITNIKGSFGKLNHSFNVVDAETGNFAIFLEGNNRLIGILFNKDFVELGRLDTPDLSSKFRSVIGYQFENKKISLLINTLNGRNYGWAQFDFQTGMGSSRELDFKIKGERVIDAVNYNNTVYLFTLPTSSSQINIYNFKDMEQPVLTALKFEEEAFLDRRERPQKLTDLVKESKYATVEVDAPNSLEVASAKFKFFQEDNIVILTADGANEFTYVININLETFEKSVSRIEKPTTDGFRMGLRTNSFIYSNKLFQIVSNTNIFKLRVVDLASNEILKEYSLTDDEELFIKNTPIVQEGGDLDSYRELETTNQFLRKSATGDIGLAVYKVNGIYQITMGSTAEKANPYLMIGGLGGIVGVIVVSSINQLTASYANYNNTKSVKFTGLFNEKLDHIQGDVPKNPFDTLKTFLEENEGQAETVFKMDDFFICGFYNNKEEVYSLYKF